ncbi:MAG: methyltransferase domain-containing protein [Ferruginibacter sp.]
MVLLRKSADKVYINTGNQDIVHLIDQPGSTILDVGCGGGILAEILSSKGHTVDGITISPKEYDATQQYARHIFLHDLERGLPKEAMQLSYDYIVCSHILEHIVYPGNLLRDIHKVLKPGGCLLVALPNIMHYKSRLKLLGGNFEYEETGIWDNTHVKWYTFESAKKLLLPHQFSIELATVTGELPFNSLFSKILPSGVRKIIFGLLIKISKGFFGYQLLLKARKVDLHAEKNPRQKRTGHLSFIQPAPAKPQE